MSRFSMTRAEAVAVLVLCALLLIGVAGLVVRDRRGGAPLTQVVSAADVPAYRVNLNAAGPAELALLPGIGPKRAADIIAYRASHGPFAAVADLVRVPGVNAKIVADLEPYAAAP